MFFKLFRVFPYEGISRVPQLALCCSLDTVKATGVLPKAPKAEESEYGSYSRSPVECAVAGASLREGAVLVLSA